MPFIARGLHTFGGSWKRGSQLWKMSTSLLPQQVTLLECSVHSNNRATMFIMNLIANDTNISSGLDNFLMWYWEHRGGQEGGGNVPNGHLLPIVFFSVKQMQPAELTALEVIKRKSQLNNKVKHSVRGHRSVRVESQRWNSLTSVWFFCSGETTLPGFPPP